MSWEEITPGLRGVAAEVCTAKQLRVLIMRTNGMSLQRIADQLGVSKPTVHQHLAAAHHRIRAHVTTPPLST